VNEPAAQPPLANLPVRRCDRVPLDAEVALRRSGKHNFRVRVFDVSLLGCQIEFVERPELAELVWIKFEGLEALAARVCWTSGFRAGVVFAAPFHPAVFEQMLSRIHPRVVK